MKRLIFLGIVFLAGSPVFGEENHPSNERVPEGTDWDYQESWRNNPKPYFKGETQPQAYRESHPYGPGGIGYDAAPDYKKVDKREQQRSNQSDQSGWYNHYNRDQ